MLNTKKYLFILILIFTLITSVKADYKCSYIANPEATSDSATEREGLFRVNTDKFEFEIKNFRDGVLLDPYIDEFFDSKTLIMLMDGKCPENVYVCLASKQAERQPVPYILINSQLKNTFKTIHIKNSILSSSNCLEGRYDKENSTALSVPSLEIFSKCDKYEKLYNELNNNYCNPNDEECSVSKISLYKKTKDRLKTYCKSVLTNGDFFNPCVVSCSNLAKDIAKIEKTSITSGQCGFSQRLLNFILNIVKWIKYIIPAIVIILGIIDFIRAIASDKDDDMKKAQGRFIKRLIAAALIFIVPFIIEFILDKMGFVAEGCGIIDF